MKKTMAIFLMVVMVLSASLCSFATSDKFVSSVSGKQAPELVEGKNVSEDCESKILITAFADKQDFPMEIREKLEEAYQMIVNAKDLSELNFSLKDIAESLDISVEDLVVSDLFDISATDCDSHDEHGHFDIILKAEALENFVCLLHYFNGVWNIVESAEVTSNGTHLEFDADEFSPFAIVVASEESPETSDNTMTYILVGVMAVSAVAIVALLIGNKKRCK